MTEQVTGIDMIEWMILAACGKLDLSDFKPQSDLRDWHSIQVRLYAEDPHKSFQPSCGTLTDVWFPASEFAPRKIGVRVETWIETGTEISPFYDPMLAKIIVTGRNRAEATQLLVQTLDSIRLYGVENNLGYVDQIIASGAFTDVSYHTKWLDSFDAHLPTVDVLEPGAQSSIQDYPGRHGYWAYGVSPSGPMDSFAHRAANALLNNKPDAAALVRFSDLMTSRYFEYGLL